MPPAIEVSARVLSRLIIDDDEHAMAPSRHEECDVYQTSINIGRTSTNPAATLAEVTMTNAWFTIRRGGR